MGDTVFSVLKFSYDNLPNDTIKACFLYLAVFPEDHEIIDDDLIFLWIGEGFFDEYDNINEAVNQGHRIIEHLKTACLLEYDANEFIKMHDVIHDMALWLASEYSGNKNKILVVEENDTVEAHQVSKWKEAQRMSLWRSGSLEELTEPLYFPNLLTLIVRRLGRFPSGFFHFMPIIKVLDLSDTKITELPTGIGKLVTLEYLNLSGTNLRELSTELKTLERIRYLRLDGMPYLEMVSEEVISNHPMMRMFLLGINYSFVEEKASQEEEPNYSREDYKALYLWKHNLALLEELEGLEHINWAYFPIVGALSFQKLSSSQKLQNVTRGLSLGNLEGMTLLQLPRMKNLELLDICRCRELQEIKDDREKEGGRRFVVNYMPNSNFHSLQRLSVYQLPKLLDLTWIIYIPSLEVLAVVECESMEEVIGEITSGVENLGIFSRLKVLVLSDLPNLKSISRRALPFPSLMQLRVEECPNLRKLPLDSNSARNTLKTIEGDSGWWEGLQWEDEIIKHTFTPYFQYSAWP